MPGFQECWRCQKISTMVVCGRCQVAKYCSSRCQERDQWRHKSDCNAAAVMQTCKKCGQVSANLKTCSACFQVFYCGVECQKKDRRRHRSDCKAVEVKIKSIAEILASKFAFNNKLVRLYYWGNYPAFDYLNLEENEGYEYGTPLRLLVCGVGDLRNVALTCASLPKNHETKVEFTLNDIEPCTLARLVLLLYMLIQGKPDEVNLVTEVWYSTKLSGSTYQSLCSFLRDLSETTSSEQLKRKTNGLLVTEDEHLNEMRRVWNAWLELPVLKSSWISEQRKQAFERDSDSQYGMYSYYLSLPSEHVKSAKQWMEDGVFVATKASLVAENPTLTGCPKLMEGLPFSFNLDVSIFPFSGWDYVQVKKFKHCNSMIDMFRGYINHVLQRFKQKITSRHVSFQSVLTDCMEIGQYLNPEVRYDRILTSNLADYILLPKLLKFCSERLNHNNPYATVITKTHNWIQFCPDADVESVDPETLGEMARWVIKDTGDPLLLRDGGTMTFRDYHDNTGQFIEYLRASFYAFSPMSRESKSTVHLPSPKKLGNEFQLKLRDFRRNENRVASFKLALNCRRPNMIVGHQRTLEWVPMK